MNEFKIVVIKFIVLVGIVEKVWVVIKVEI